MTMTGHDLLLGWSIAGGSLIGAGTSVYLLGLGRIAGISGILFQALKGPAAIGRSRPDAPPAAFLVGLMAAPWVLQPFWVWPARTMDVGPASLVMAGFLVGIGVRMGNGCTSGHGVCGLARFSPRSLIHVVAFMGAGMATVWLMRHVL